MVDIKKQQFVLRMPEDLLKQIDDRAKEKGISRNEWFTRFATWFLTNAKGK